MTAPARRAERGMTLVELLLALFVFSFVMAGALAFLRAQSHSFSLGKERVGMYQNFRYALNVLEKDLRTAGAGTASQQPQMIYAGTNIVAFNANYWTNTPGDVEAVYYNPNAPDSAVQAMLTSSRITLPLTAFQYPETSYVTGGIDSPAETIIFYFEPDSSNAGDYVLMRQVNNTTPEVVSRYLQPTAGVNFFQYYESNQPPNATPSLTLVPTAALPLIHTVALHLSPADTGAAARIDSIAAVRVSFTVTNGQSGGLLRTQQISRMISLPNVGLANQAFCGNPPVLGVTPVALATTQGGQPAVQVTWAPAVDDAGGQKTVEQYVLWRRVSTDTSWGDPYINVPAGQASYTYMDLSVAHGTSYYYNLAAQDCTPSLSTTATSNLVAVP
jgi:prepilin-type N-terminal cleavage/methylation domain-containing protein